MKFPDWRQGEKMTPAAAPYLIRGEHYSRVGFCTALNRKKPRRLRPPGLITEGTGLGGFGVCTLR
jgi:hypothetical protein